MSHRLRLAQFSASLSLSIPLTRLSAAAAKSYIHKMTSSLIVTHFQEINSLHLRALLGIWRWGRGLIHKFAFFVREHSMQYVIVNFRDFVSSSQFPKTLVNNRQFMLRKNAENQPHRHRGRRLKSHNGLHYTHTHKYIHINQWATVKKERNKERRQYLSAFCVTVVVFWWNTTSRCA